jgi:hypothetical protein
MENLDYTEALRKELAPKGLLENTFVDEIIYATARLRRCADDDDHSRTFAHRILRNSIADLRRLQTDRQIREELDPDLPATGLASYRDLIAAFNARATLDLQTRKARGADTISKIIDNSLPKPPSTAPVTQESKPESENWVRFVKENSPVVSANALPNTPAACPRETRSQSKAIGRNAPCPCGSRDKFKRCCGRDAPSSATNDQLIPAESRAGDRSGRAA